MVFNRRSALARKAQAAERMAQEAATTTEIVRLSSLDSRWLARALLRMARQLRVARLSEMAQQTQRNARLYWQLVPELAWRLGERTMRIGERTDGAISQLSDQDLRKSLLQALRESTPTLDSHAGRVFFREINDGNPIVLALNRLVPPSPPAQISGIRQACHQPHSFGHVLAAHCA